MFIIIIAFSGDEGKDLNIFRLAMMEDLRIFIIIIAFYGDVRSYLLWKIRPEEK